MALARFLPTVTRAAGLGWRAVGSWLRCAGLPRSCPMLGHGSQSWPPGVCRSFSSSASPDDERDPYKLLGVEKGASADEMKAAYRKQALKWHPDRQPAEKRQEAERRFSAIASAYELLSDPEKRRQYDAGGGAQPGAPGAGPRGPGQGSGGPGFHGGFYGPSHSQESADELFRRAFGGKGLEEILEQFFGAVAGLAAIEPGMEVQVIQDWSALLSACRECGIDPTNDDKRRRSMGRRALVIKVDTRDQTVKLSVEGIGDVWVPIRSVRPRHSPAIGRIGGLGGFGAFSGQGMQKPVSINQQWVTTPDGRRVLRITKRYQRDDGKWVEEVDEILAQ